jgi:hypothetical protein
MACLKKKQVLSVFQNEKIMFGILILKLETLSDRVYQNIFI